MADYDLRLELPAHAYVTFQILSLLEQGGTLHEAKDRLFSREPYRSQKLNPYDMKVFSHSALISVLFCAIVVPREFLDLPRDHKLYRDYDTAKVLSYFNIREPAAMDSYYLRGQSHFYATER